MTEKIVLEFSATDNFVGTKVAVFSIREAQKEISHRLGHWEIGSHYGISADGIVRVEILEGNVKLQDLHPHGYANWGRGSRS